MTNAIGWISNNLLAWCALPAVLDIIEKGTADGYSGVFLAMWLVGEILGVVYMVRQKKVLYPILFNYSVNILLISIIVYYKL